MAAHTPGAPHGLPGSSTRRRRSPASPAEPPHPVGLSALAVWARSAPIRLAGYEDDLLEPHLLPGVD
ncbi:hypothetical protein AB0E06_35415 [Streptomyces sp. NPDC048109]|uniref:hypothetical protein n=1 Tax=unclassified Streptomyces TaxID=2593676 RepID=UPI0033EA9817